MTKREFLDTVFALAPNEANAIMDAFDEYVESNVVPTGRSGKERRMSKYIIELDDRIKLVTSVGVTENGVVYTTSDYVHNLEELNSDYINEHYGSLQDEAYRKGFEDGKKSVSEPDRIEVGDEVEWDGDKYVVTYLNYNIETSEITDYDLLAYDGSVVDHVKKCAFTKTGKHYDIASILEAMRTHD